MDHIHTELRDAKDTLGAASKDALLKHVDIETATSLLLRWSLEDISLDELLSKALELILSISWLVFDGKGSIFLVGEEPDVLEMCAERGLPDEMKRQCSRVDFGSCLCGLAAAKREMQFADQVDERHLPCPTDVPHGHYCVPIASNGSVLGVVNVYLREGHRRDVLEEEFLGAVADALAGVIQRTRAQQRLRESETQLSSIVGAYAGLLYMVAPDYRVEFMNQKFKDIIGGDPVGDLCYKAIHGLDEPCGWCTNDRVFEGETVSWELRLKQDGRYYLVVNRPVIHHDGSLSKLSMATDITERRLAEQKLQDSVEELEAALEGVVHALASTTSQRDPYTAFHQERVSRLACAIAEKLGLDEERIDGIRVAELLHDVGKVAIPSEILSKPGTLSDMEWGIIRTHSSVGHKLLESVPFRWPVADIVLQHHERLDGSGYPDGLHEEELLLEAKVLAVADVVEAMASHRPYRPALGIDRALEEVTGLAGTAFDHDVVDACVAVVQESGFEL